MNTPNTTITQVTSKRAQRAQHGTQPTQPSIPQPKQPKQHKPKRGRPRKNPLTPTQKANLQPVPTDTQPTRRVKQTLLTMAQQPALPASQKQERILSTLLTEVALEQVTLRFNGIVLNDPATWPAEETIPIPLGSYLAILANLLSSQNPNSPAPAPAQVTLSRGEIFTRMIFDMALSGNVQMAKLAFDRIEGLPARLDAPTPQAPTQIMLVEVSPEPTKDDQDMIEPQYEIKPTSESQPTDNGLYDEKEDTE